MNWEAVSAIGEIIGATAVVATLLYLALQMRQNTWAMRSSTWQSIQDAEQRFDISLTENPRNLEVFLKGAEGLAVFNDPAERKLYEMLVKQLIDLFQTHHYQHEIGIIDDDLWETWVRQFEEDIQMAGIREVVMERHHMFRPSFRHFVDTHLRQTT